MAKPKKSPPRFATELVLWEHVPRSSRKGYLTRDFYVGSNRYRWTSNGVNPAGLMRYGVLCNEA